MLDTPEFYNPAYRPAVRLASAFMLDQADRLTRTLDQDIVTSLVYLGVAWENVKSNTLPPRSGLEIDPERRLSQRAPVSVYALSRTIHAPYETTRRHVGRLLKAGLCERTPQGLVARQMTLPGGVASPVADETWDATERFLRDLAAVGVEMPAPRRAPVDQIRRRVTRLSMEFFLAGMSAVTEALETDVVSALLFLAINRANAAVLTDPTAPLPDRRPGEILPDEARRAVTTYALARRLRLPYETTRRHIAKLTAAGHCERQENGGLVVPARVIGGPRVTQALAPAWDAVQNLLVALQDLGMPMPSLAQAA